MKKLVLAVITLAFSATSAFAAESAEQAAAPAGAKPGSDKVVCKREKIVGSNLSASSICMTRAEWQQLKDDSKRQLRNSGNRTLKIVHENGG